MRRTTVTIWAATVVLLTTTVGLGDLTDGLVAYYPFNGNANDAAGGYDLTIDGATAAADRFGKPGRAYSLDGIDDSIYGPSYDAVVPSAQGSFAVSFWFAPATTWTPTNNPNSSLVGNHRGFWPDGLYDWGVFIHGPTAAYYQGKLSFWWIEALPEPDDGTWLELATTTSVWNAGTWYHVLVNYSALTENLSMWINGTRENQMTVTDDIGRNLASNILTVGRYESRYTDMAIDELRLYNRGLSAGEIKELSVVPAPAAVVLGGLGLGYSMALLRRRRAL